MDRLVRFDGRAVSNGKHEAALFFQAQCLTRWSCSARESFNIHNSVARASTGERRQASSNKALSRIGPRWLPHAAAGRRGDEFMAKESYM